MRNKMSISGYVIVIRKNMSYYYFSRDKRKKELVINNVYYSGIGRMWDYWLPNDAPQSIKTEVDKANSSYHNSLMYKMFVSFEAARMVLSYLNGEEQDYQFEILGIHSQNLPELEKIRDDISLKFIGVDIDSEGHYLIKEELFAAKIQNDVPQEFCSTLEKLNSNGLFSSIDEAKAFVSVYLERYNVYGLEPIVKNKTNLISLYEIRN